MGSEDAIKFSSNKDYPFLWSIVKIPGFRVRHTIFARSLE